MLKTSRTTLRNALPCLLLALALVVAALAAPAAHAGPAAPGAVQVWVGSLLDTVRGWMPASAEVVTSGSEAGPYMDPNRIEADAGPDLGPNGCTVTPGNGGDAEAGGDMDPDG